MREQNLFQDALSKSCAKEYKSKSSENRVKSLALEYLIFNKINGIETAALTQIIKLHPQAM